VASFPRERDDGRDTTATADHGRRVGSYEYDLAHEATASPPLQRPPARLPEPETMHAADSGGDYGYDAAHDLT
jgi:hypothetical protein